MNRTPKQRWTTNLARVEIEIFTGCNLACPNCDRSSPQAPSNEGMGIDQIGKFVQESIGLDWKWDRVTLLGGEPTLHPDFAELIKVLHPLHKQSPITNFRIYSNGFGRAVKRRLDAIPEWIEVCNTHKTREAPVFSAYNIAPIDYPGPNVPDFTKACAITARCGMGLTRYGYYPCGAGASIDRVFGLDIGIKSLALVTPESVLAQIRQLCRLCGHFTDFDDRIENNGVIPITWTREAQTSDTWSAAYDRYRTARPTLSLY